MNCLSNLKKGLGGTTKPPSKRSKDIKGRVFCLFPTEVEQAAYRACENEKNKALDLLLQMAHDNELKKTSNNRPKNHLVEKIIDQTFDSIIQTLVFEVKKSVREDISSRVYEQIEESACKIDSRMPLNMKTEVESDEYLTLEAGKFAQQKRISVTIQVKALIYIKLYFFFKP